MMTYTCTRYPNQRTKAKLIWFVKNQCNTYKTVTDIIGLVGKECPFLTVKVVTYSLETTE